MNASKTELISTVNQVQRIRIANAPPLSKNEHHLHGKSLQLVYFRGMSWTSEQCNKCPERGKKCNNCGIENQFAKVCRKPKDP